MLDWVLCAYRVAFPFLVHPSVLPALLCSIKPLASATLALYVCGVMAATAPDSGNNTYRLCCSACAVLWLYVVHVCHVGIC